MAAEPFSWSERVAKLGELGGDSWGEAEQDLREDWEQAYVAAFTRIALERGWKQQDAAEWARQLCGEAYAHAYLHDFDPEPLAREDVKTSEGGYD